MLIIRFSKTGKKNQPQYRIVLAEKTFPVQGKFLEILGSYNPHSKETILKEEKIKEWLSKGASCSDSVFNLLVSKGVIKEKKRQIPIKQKAGKDGEEKNDSKKSEKKPIEEIVNKTEGEPEEEKSDEKSLPEKSQVEKIQSEEIKTEAIKEDSKSGSIKEKEEQKETTPEIKVTGENKDEAKLES